MASLLLGLGRFVFFTLIVTQCFLLAYLPSYPAEYKVNSDWFGVSSSFAPSVIAWVALVLLKAAKLRRLFSVWGLYVFGLVVSIGVVFGVVGDGIEKKTLGPIVLKGTLCVTPLLLLLLLNTASDREEHKEVVSKLCFQLAVDLFDGVEMIDIVLDEKEHNYGISKGFGIAMIVLACRSFVLTLWPMAENDPRITPKRCTAIARNVVEMVMVNGAFLVIRLVIVFKYKKDESIFIVKNIIAIILSILEICDIRTSDDYIHCGGNSFVSLSMHLRLTIASETFMFIKKKCRLNFTLNYSDLKTNYFCFDSQNNM